MPWTCQIGLHRWAGCKCRVCGRKRDVDHTWDGCCCSVCGRQRDSDHTWGEHRCQICGAIRPEQVFDELGLKRTTFEATRQLAIRGYPEMPSSFIDTYAKHAIIISGIVVAFKKGHGKIAKSTLRSLLRFSGVTVSLTELDDLLFPLSTDCKESNMKFLIISPGTDSLGLYQTALNSWYSCTNAKRWLSVFGDLFDA